MNVGRYLMQQGASGRVFPPIPTRDQVCGVNVTLQGLMVKNTQQYNGMIPWFGAALAWLNPENRLNTYDAQRATKRDTHVIIELPDGAPVYDERDQVYDRAHFGPLDMTNGFTKVSQEFIDIVVEVICQPSAVPGRNFIPMIFLDEAHEASMASLPLLMQALKTNSYGVDLTPYCLILPGWDGVFYGWPNDGVTIPAWAALARSFSPLCHLGLEHNTGHIPLGEGGGDYLPGGRMNGFDVVLSEYGGDQNGMAHDDDFWQIVGRMVRPYHRPADQPAHDDPNPPFYLADPNPRGAYFYCAYEFGFDMYYWVRLDRYGNPVISLEQIQRDRAYCVNAGCSYTG